MFDNEEFMEGAKLIICSVQYLIVRFEEAKKNQDVEFLRHLRKVHKESRSFLNYESVKF